MTDFAAEAKHIHASLPVVDGHNDLPWAIRVRAGGSLDVADPRRHLAGYHTDTARLLEGGVGGQFWSVYVPSWRPDPFDEVMAQVSLVQAMVAADPRRLTPATTAADVMRAREERKVASLIGAEGGHAIEGSLDKLEALAAAGVRYMTLTHGSTIEWADSATDIESNGGLTGFGREVVREMNRLGMLVDISHVSAATMRHAIDASVVPVIASHSGARAVTDHPRNVPDDVLRAVGETGGVVMAVFCPAFVVASTARSALDMFEAERALRAEFDPQDEAGFAAASAARATAMQLDPGTVGHVVDHLEHIAEVAGVASVGIGSDFDGIETTPTGLEDVSCFPAVTEELLRRGWPEQEIRMTLGDNVLRVLEQAERTAA
ncbi:MAG TPA: dipeptidase [Acidimicrobiia bacterium]|jgi:membrane dipeptidase